MYAEELAPAREIARAIERGLKEIGKEGAGGMGALEGLAVMIKAGLEEVAAGLHAIAEKMPE